ncbi:hypothetical protein MMC10_006321 [Thelotrema lepadinum]|nr:hypothetical protein [Thelotrema lepadinum]
MKFLAVSVFAIAALAAPTSRSDDHITVRAQAMEAALGHLHNLQAAGCSIIKCATALAPTVVGCAAAAAEEFVNPVADLSCIASAANTGFNPPDSCVTCFDEALNATGIGSREVNGKKRVILTI